MTFRDDRNIISLLFQTFEIFPDMQNNIKEKTKLKPKRNSVLLSIKNISVGTTSHHLTQFSVKKPKRLPLAQQLCSRNIGLKPQGKNNL